ncbi:Clp protease N-terminal domain-containing protein [Nocardiopsis nanhaiensis]
METGPVRRSADFTPRAARMLDEARRIAAESGVTGSEGNPVVGAEHLFLAILADEDGVPAQRLLRDHDLPAVRASVRAVLDSPDYPGYPGPG